MIRVLHVNDDTEQLRYVRRFLEAMERDIRIESVISPEEVPAKLLKGAFNAVLSGFSILGMNEIDLGVAVGRAKDIPFILYEGRGKEEVAKGTSRRSVEGIVREEAAPGHIKDLADKSSRP